MYKYVLIDLDNTILDFHLAEKKAHKKTSEEFNIFWSESLYEKYHVINDSWWKRLERGECTKQEVKVNRYVEYFSLLNVSVSPKDFSDRYLVNLSLGKDLIQGALETLKKLYDSGLKLYIATNGVYEVQKNRLNGQEFMKYIEGVFVSEKLGYQKPQKEFFIAASKEAGVDFTKDTIIVGDSLTSDMLGGVNYGIDTLWVNKDNLENHLNLNLTYVVNNITEIVDILTK